MARSHENSRIHALPLRVSSSSLSPQRRLPVCCVDIRIPLLITRTLTLALAYKPIFSLMIEITKPPMPVVESTCSDVDESKLKVDDECNALDLSGNDSLGGRKQFSLARRFQIVISSGERSKISKKSDRGRAPKWEQSFLIDNTSITDSMRIKVYTIPSLFKKELIGEIEETVKPAPGTIYEDGHFELRFKVTLSSALDMMDQETNLGRKRLESIHHASDKLQTSPGRVSGFAQLDPSVESVGQYCLRLEAFMILAGEIAEVHPYTRVAWSVLAVGYKILQRQMQLDDAMIDLLQAMDEVSSLVKDSPSDANHNDFQKKIIAKIVQQTTECGYFIQQYAEEKDFGSRAVKNLVSPTNQVIQKLTLSLEKLRRAFTERTTQEVEIVVLQTLKIVENLALDVTLSDIPYADGVSFAPEKGCLPHTRTQTLIDISEWGAAFRSAKHGSKDEGQNEERDQNLHEDDEAGANYAKEAGTVGDNTTGASLYWLTGLAGAGKSAIAHTIADRFYSLRRLGSSFFFDKSDANKRNASAVFPKISRDLADLNPAWKAELGRITASGASNSQAHELRHTDSVQRQFKEFILEPAKKVTFFGPIFIVIDALDECDDNQARSELLKCISEDLHLLPRNFRILVTSRLEQEIEQAFANVQNVEHHPLVSAAEEDLEIYYRNTFKHSLPEFDKKWPNKEWTKALVKKSEGSFQWAFTACRFILEPGWDKTERLTELLATPELQGIDKLYMTILHTAFPFEGEEDGRIPRFRKVLGRLLCVYDPLSITDLTNLCGAVENNKEEYRKLTLSILREMGSLLTGVEAGSLEPVQALHSSFRDFLFDEKRSQIYHVVPAAHDKTLAKACLTVLNTELKFNICGFKSSYSSMKPLDLDNAKARISNQLLYASKFWADHLEEWDSVVADLVRTFIRTKFLFWLELLALSRNIHSASNSTSLMVDWAKKYGDEELVSFGDDARKFISSCADDLAFSPQHLYISALPLAPRSSVVSKQYLSRFDKTVKVRSDKHHEWSPVIKVLANRGESEKLPIKAMSFCFDGISLITATAKSLNLWNTDSGKLLTSRPINTEHPIIVASPDKLIAATTSSDQVIITEISNHELTCEPLKVSDHPIICLQISPNSKTLWVGTTAGHLSAWDIQTTVTSFSVQLLDLPEPAGPGIEYMTMSRDTTHLAFALYDCSVSIFSRKHGSMEWIVQHKLPAPEDTLCALDLSPDGLSLVAGHHAGHVRVFDVNSGTYRPKRSSANKHTAFIKSVAISPDEEEPIAVSSAGDQTLRLWDLHSMSPIGTPMTGFGFEDIESVRFSMDGKYIATGADDGTVYLLDSALVEQSSLNARDDKKVLHRVVAVAPGERIFSGSTDGSIHRFSLSANARSLRPLRGHEGVISDLAISPNGKHLVSCSEDKTIRLWDVKTGKAIRIVSKAEKHDDRPRSVSFDQQGKRLLSCGGKTVSIWDTTKWTKITKPLEGHDDVVCSAHFFDDDDHIISASWDSTIRIWDAETGDPTDDPLKIPDDVQAKIRTLTLSPTKDLAAIALYNGNIVLLNLNTLLFGRQLHHGTERVNSVVFSADGTQLLSSSEDRTIRLWDISNGELMGRPWEGHSSGVNMALFLEETRIVSAADEGIIRIWDIEDDSDSESLKSKPQAELERSFPRIDNDGWVYSEDEGERKLLFWLPQHYRSTFLWGRCKKLLGTDPTIIDFSEFEHGDRWIHCSSDLFDQSTKDLVVAEQTDTKPPDASE
ncbi:WD40 repeat-like protein [Sistotremastrum suecicum HHB10207 ss-3]|uniref:WD40 repeat-like protein n=1 Tax=Sistotremastrum suecicum HHB10207 ss-3 TaxID=1314776 RepID=A0A166E8Y6_9AGAM|nr:WD40 repeat-like protein [Sistotremastrum suecicum HHB10207 ss-3]